MRIKGFDYWWERGNSWHLWFAWRPVKVGKYADKSYEYAWLTMVYKRRTYDGWDFGTQYCTRAFYENKIRKAQPE